MQITKIRKEKQGHYYQLHRDRKDYKTILQTTIDQQIKQPRIDKFLEHPTYQSRLKKKSKIPTELSEVWSLNQ